MSPNWRLRVGRLLAAAMAMGMDGCTRSMSLRGDASSGAETLMDAADRRETGGVPATDNDGGDARDDDAEAGCADRPCVVRCSEAQPCPVGTGCCEGTCAALSNDPSRCGACGRACGEQEYCRSDADGSGCAPFAPPRLLSPLSTATVTTRRPTLRWERRARDLSVRVEICRDRACALPVSTFDVSGDRGAPDRDLPTGPLYWRVRQGAVGVSPTWRFDVGARSAPVDTSWGDTADYNGDGYADLAVGASGVTVAGVRYAGRVHVYLGSATGLPATPTLSLDGPDGREARFGDAVASVGDLNGDGYVELAVGAWSASIAGPGSGGRVHIYFGSATGLSAAASQSLDGPGGVGGYFGWAVAGAGDVNRDGYADLAVGAPGTDSADGSAGAGRVHIYFGGADGLASAPDQTLDAPDGFLGEAIESAGDVNGDGFADLAVGARGTRIAGASGPGGVQVYYGSAGGLVATPRWRVEGYDGPSGEYGRAFAAGDINADGYADLAIGAPGAAVDGADDAGRVHVYLGGPAGLAATPSQGFHGSGWNHRYGGTLAGIGDIDGDGYADLAVGESSGRTWISGTLHILSGSSTGLAASAQSLEAPYGCPDARAGDVNGDGYPDLVLGSPHESSSVISAAGRVHVHLGSATGLGPLPNQSLDGPDDSEGGFGGALASASRPRGRGLAVQARPPLPSGLITTTQAVSSLSDPSVRRDGDHGGQRRGRDGQRRRDGRRRGRGARALRPGDAAAAVSGSERHTLTASVSRRTPARPP